VVTFKASAVQRYKAKGLYYWYQADYAAVVGMHLSFLGRLAAPRILGFVWFLGKVWLPQISWYVFGFATLWLVIFYSQCGPFVIELLVLPKFGFIFLSHTFCGCHTFMASHTLAWQNLARNQTPL
jgi:hypothetical protein